MASKLRLARQAGGMWLKAAAALVVLAGLVTPINPAGAARQDPAPAAAGLAPWTSATALPQSRIEFAAIASQNNVYVIGGNDPSQGQNQLATVERAVVAGNGTLGAWQATSPLTTTRVGFAAVISDTHVYALGGYHQIVDNFERFNSVQYATVNPNGTLGNWQDTQPMNGIRSGLGAVAAKGYVYAIGGYDDLDGGRVLTTVERALVNSDGTLAAWTETQPLAIGKEGLTAVTAGDYIYAIGGRSVNSIVANNVVERALIHADGSLGAWQIDAPLVNARYDAAAVVSGGTIYVTGGWNNEAQDTVEYAAIQPDGSLSAWQMSPATMSTPRERHAAAVVGEQLFVFGGFYTQTLSSVERASLNDPLGPTATGLLINGGAQATTDISTTLSISATDPDDSSQFLQMSFSNDSSNWSNWAALAPQANWNLPAGDGPKAVYLRVRDAFGNISPAISSAIQLDTAVGTENTVSINQGALFTNNIDVQLRLGARPGTAEMQLSNDGGFAAATWRPYAASSAWTITQFGNYVIPRVVYARFKDIHGSVSGSVSDDIILDVTPPTGTVTIELASLAAGPASRPAVSAPATLGYRVFLPLVLDDYCFVAAGPVAVTLHLAATDDVSGVSRMKFSHEPSFACSNWLANAASAPWQMDAGGTVYVRFSDRAGNLSQTATSTLP